MTHPMLNYFKSSTSHMYILLPMCHKISKTIYKFYTFSSDLSFFIKINKEVYLIQKYCYNVFNEQLYQLMVLII